MCRSGEEEGPENGVGLKQAVVRMQPWRQVAWTQGGPWRRLGEPELAGMAGGEQLALCGSGLTTDREPGGQW